MLPGEGCVPRMSRPSARASVSTRVMIWISWVAAAGEVAREASRCSAPMISAISPRTARAAEIDQPVGDPAERRIRRQSRRVVRSAALERQDQIRDVAPLALVASTSVPASACAMQASLLGRPHRAAFGLNRDDLDRLAVAAGGVGEVLRHHLLAAERDDHNRADVGMRAVGGQRLVRDAHVGPELPAAGQVRQRHADRRGSRGDALGDDRRTDHGRHDEHVVARADAAVGAAVAEEARARRLSVDGT